MRFFVPTCVGWYGVEMRFFVTIKIYITLGILVTTEFSSKVGRIPNLLLKKNLAVWNSKLLFNTIPMFLN